MPGVNNDKITASPWCVKVAAFLFLSLVAKPGASLREDEVSISNCLNQGKILLHKDKRN